MESSQGVRSEDQELGAGTGRWTERIGREMRRDMGNWLPRSGFWRALPRMIRCKVASVSMGFSPFPSLAPQSVTL